MNTLLLIDGNAVMHRAFHAIPPFKTKQGIPTNVLYGFFSMLHKAVVDFSPSHVVVCFDTPKPTFRNKLFKKYQAQRPKIDDDFIVQIPTVKEALDRAGVIHLEKDGYEADDLLGTIAEHYNKNDIKVLVLSGDKDILQLVKGNVYVVSPQGGISNMTIYDRSEVQKKLGVTPEEIPDYKALAGDPADNYPGAKGIGPKTAANLIKQFGSVENIYRNLDKVESPKIKQILSEKKDSVLLGKKLAKIITDVKIEFAIDKTKYGGFNDNLKDYLLKFEMKGLVSRLFAQKKQVKKTAEKKQEIPQPSLF